jgi:hypothetical protein
VEKENNAREITLQQADADIEDKLDNEFLQKLKSEYPTHQMVGNYKSVVMVEGSAGSQILTLETLIPDDPRMQALQIQPEISSDFGLFEVIISNSLGEMLYGKTEWENLWQKNGTEFTGDLLTFSINDIPLQEKFRVVARQIMPGRKIYVSTKLGLELKKYSVGLGSESLKLPVVEDQIQYSLPKFETMRCFIDFPKNRCHSEQQIIKRLRAENYKVIESQHFLENINRYQVTLTKIDDLAGNVQIQETKGDCEERLSHHVQSCPSAAVIPKISLYVKLDKIPRIQLSGITSQSYDLLPGISDLQNKHGGENLDFWADGLSERGVNIVAPYGTAKLGKTSMQIGDVSIPVFITTYYQCPQGKVCPFYTMPLAVFRLQNVANHIARFLPDSVRFLPTNPRIDYDEILFFANQVEEVKSLFQQLRKNHPSYNVSYNIYAIKKLERQDKRLSILFNLTVVLSVLFILLAVGALAKSNVDRRQRQMAQLFLLGYSKLFVSLVLVCEYMLLTILASITAIGVGSGVFAVARHFLQSASEQRITEFTTIVNSMSLDLYAFANVFLIVVSLTLLVAVIAAFYASKSEPVELLD